MNNSKLRIAALIFISACAIQANAISIGGGSRPGAANVSGEANLSDLIKKARENTRLNPSEAVVLRAISEFTKGSADCEQLLGSARPSTTFESDAPSWLLQAAKSVFIDRQELDAVTLVEIENHKFLSDVVISAKGDVKSVNGFERVVRRALLEAAPGAVSLGSKLNIVIRDITVSWKNYLSFKLSVEFQNGQKINLQIRDADIGVQERDVAIGNIVVAAIYSREILGSEEKLRQEMNALRFDLMKLVRVSSPSVQIKVTALISAIENHQPKSNLMSGLLNGFSFTRGTDTIMGDAFMAYLSAKNEIVAIAQRMKEDQYKVAQAANKGTSVKTRLPGATYVKRPTNRPSARTSPHGFFAPTHRAVDDSSSFNTFLWFYDPMYMISHPWYWGNKNGSFMNYWMMYDWMSNHATRTDHRDRSLFEGSVYSQPDMKRFDQPIDPIYSNRADQPFLNPWEPQVSEVHGQIIPRIDQSGAVEWTDQRGRPADTGFYSDEEKLQKRWVQETGDTSRPEDRVVDSPPVIERILNTPQEIESFTTPSSGSGWGAGSTIENHPQRDKSIKGYL